MAERTVRAWLAAIRREVAQELRERHADELLLAVEAVRHVAATAWAAYEREADRELADATNPKLARRAGPALRYLTLAAHVQAARLLGLYRKDVQAAYDAALAESRWRPRRFPHRFAKSGRNRQKSPPPVRPPRPRTPRIPEIWQNRHHAPPSRRNPRPTPPSGVGKAGPLTSGELAGGVGSPKSAPTDTTAAPEPARAGFVAARPPVAASAASHLPQPSQTRQKRQNRQKPRPSRRYPVRATFILKAPTR